MTVHTVSTGHLHLAVHNLLGSHREAVGKAVRDRARSQLQIDLVHANRVEATIAPTCLSLHQQDPPPAVQCINAHAVARADIHRIRRALTITTTPIRPGPGLLLQVTAPHTNRPALAGIDLVKRVQDDTEKLRHLLREELQVPEYPNGLWNWQQRLWLLPTLAERLPHPDRHPLVKSIDDHCRRWINASRVLLGHVAPMVTLSTPCPHCDLTSLIVREDATSDVVCITEDCVDENGDQSRWGRIHWPALLDGRYATGLVNTEAASLALGVEAATVRDWKRRGLITPAVNDKGLPLGTSRQPYYRLTELLEAAVAPKPRRTA
jgi:hypothetical protein